MVYFTHNLGCFTVREEREMKATQDKQIDGGDVFCEDAVQDSGGRVV